jgi:hypothetical protein
MKTLGLVAIVSGGTPVQITDKSIGAVTVTLQPKPGNAGVVYVGGKGMVIASGVNIAGVIPKPASATTGPFGDVTLLPLGTGSGGYRLDEIYIDGTTGDGVYVRYM